jgi:CHAT domain-containing protein/Flp pilus assembly protein TadD
MMKIFILIHFSLFIFFENSVFCQLSSYDALNTRYERLKKENQYDSALVVAKKIRDWVLQKEGDTSLRKAIGLRLVGECFSYLQKYDSSLHYLNYANRVFSKQHRSEHPEGIKSILSLAIVQYSAKALATADSTFKRVIPSIEAVFGEKSTEYLKAVFNYSSLLEELAELKEAEKWMLKGAAVSKELEGENGATYAKFLNGLGRLSATNDNFLKAEEYYKKTLEIRRKIYGENHPSYALILNNLGSLYRTIGDNESAEKILSQSLKIYEATMGKDNPEYARALNNLALVFKLNNNYQKAESCFIESYEIRKKSLGDIHPDVAGSLTNLGLLYRTIGDYKSADKFYSDALNLHKNLYGENHILTAGVLNNIGTLYYYQRDYTNAGLYWNKALAIRINTHGEEHTDCAGSYHNLGNLYSAQGHYDKAEENYLKSINIKLKKWGADSKEYATSLNNLGSMYTKSGNYPKAEEYIMKAIGIFEKKLQANHPSVLEAKGNLVELYTKTNRFEEALKLKRIIFNRSSKVLLDNFEWLNEAQKEAYSKQGDLCFSCLSSFVDEVVTKLPEAAELNFDSELISKGKLLQSKINTEEYYLERDQIREELAYRRRLINKMESEGSEKTELINRLSLEADSLDNRLQLTWPEYAEQKKSLSITWREVQQNLDKNEAAIEFVRFQKDDSLFYYNALVLRNNGQPPMLIKLCKEKEIARISPRLGFSAFYPLIWQPIEESLKGIQTIYYAPTGLLNNIPFSALYAATAAGDKLVEEKTDKRGIVTEPAKATSEKEANYLLDRYTLHQVISTRYLAMGLKQKEKNPIPKDMLMAGGVNYDYLPGSTSVAVKKGKQNKQMSRSSESVSGKLAYLNGTKVEVEQINNTLIQNTWTSTVLSGNDATEENIINFEGKDAKGILHLATHGYAFSEYEFKDTTINKKSLRYSYRFSQNPMVRSGLILTGGNWAWTGSDTLTKLGAEQNGILTAAEVSQLNLRKTKLVVLSACETGLGTIDGSEGTFGLKRGFKLAGVEQMIVSLWSVPDKETMELMTLFYTDLAKTLNPITSFEKAQKEMRTRYPQDPEKWAGFMLIR